MSGKQMIRVRIKRKPNYLKQNMIMIILIVLMITLSVCVASLQISS